MKVNTIILSVIAFFVILIFFTLASSKVSEHKKRCGICRFDMDPNTGSNYYGVQDNPAGGHSFWSIVFE